MADRATRDALAEAGLAVVRATAGSWTLGRFAATPELLPAGSAVRTTRKPKSFLSTPWNGSRVRTQSAGRLVLGEKSATECASTTPAASHVRTKSAART